MRSQGTRRSRSIRSPVAVLTAAILVLGLALSAAPVAAASGPTVYWGAKGGPISLPVKKFVAAATLPLPAGRYLVTATATLEGRGASAFEPLAPHCRLVIGSSIDRLYASPTEHDGAGSRVPILLVVAGRLSSPGSAKLRCIGGSDSKGDVRISDIRMRAIRVGRMTLREVGGANVTYGQGSPRIISQSSLPSAWTWVEGNGTYQDVGKLELPAGRWWVMAKGVAVSGGSIGSPDYRCRLYAGLDHDDVKFGFPGLAEDLPSMPFALNTLHPFDSPGRAKLQCKGPKGFFVWNIGISAIKAGTLVNLPLDPGAIGWSLGSGVPKIWSGYANGTSPNPAMIKARLSHKTIRKLTLPKGRWTVLSKLWFEGTQGTSGTQSADCRLVYGKKKSPSHLYWETGRSGVAPMVMSIDHRAKSAQSVKLQCRRWSTGGTARAYFIKITGLKAGSLIKRPL